jgi:hypothetical protein
LKRWVFATNPQQSPPPILRKEVTQRMDTALKTQPKALYDEPALSFAGLMKVELDLKTELETALEATDIDAEKIVDIRERLSQIPLKIVAAKIAETKKKLNEIHDSLLTADENKKLIHSVLVQRRIELEEKLKELEPFWERYNRCGVQTSFVNNEIELLRIARRENKALLFSLSDEIRK